ncbi:MAG TPA: KH domain-containing protein, partial [Thermoplasmata archaeon]|nr:KH domain-containing protein [Thermoplasmata archaeon]
MTRQSVRIPKDRIGVLIGRKGGIKAQVEARTGVRITVDSEEGDVTIDYSKAENPSFVLPVM